MDIDIKCNVLEAKYCIKNGMLRCVEPFVFSLTDPAKVQIEIKEMGIRVITLSTDEKVEARKLYAILVKLEKLLQIFDGAFVPLEGIVLHGEEEEEKYQTFVTQLIAQRLHYFASADIFSVHSDRIINYEDVLSEVLFNTWQKVLDDLGVINQMYLYATSDCGLTNDVKCAFLVELAESLIEIIGKTNVTMQKLPNEKGNLKPCLRTIIKEFGKELFARELQYDLEKILTCLVNTRVNIMHIKINQRTPKLNGREATLYTMKMSYLYRLVILKRLQVGENFYLENLKEKTRLMNEWNGILDELFVKLK